MISSRLLIASLGLAAGLAAQPRRIVSTAPSITETLFALGLGDRVVGVSQYCHYPPEAARRPKVGTYLKPNVEAIVGLRPDLAILERSPEDAPLRLRNTGVRTLEVEYGGLERSLAAIQAIGSAAGAPERARRLVDGIRARLQAIRQANTHKPRRTLVFIVGRNPSRLDGMIAVGRSSYLNELIEIAGGLNALATSMMPYPKVSLESLIGLNPDVLVDMGDMSDTTNVTEEHKREVVALWKRYPALKAVAGNRVFAVASDIFVVPGPRVVDAAEAFARMLHPEGKP